MKDKKFNAGQVIDFYTNVYDEDARLKKDRRHIVEFETKKKLLIEEIPPGSIVYDIGAGTGVWSEFVLGNIENTKVYAFDLVPEHVTKINEKLTGTPGFMGAYVLDILSVDKCLDFKNALGTADVVMMAGPLYHIKEYTERQAAMKHASWFLGESLTSVMIVDWLSASNAAMETILNPDCRNRVIIGPYNIFSTWPNNIFAYSNETRMKVLGRSVGLQTVRHYAYDGISRLVAGSLNSLSEEKFNEWLELSSKMATMNGFCNFSEHNATVYTKIDFNSEDYAPQEK